MAIKERCPLPPSRCQKYKCPDHPNNGSNSGLDRSCRQGPSCGNRTCNKHHAREPAPKAKKGSGQVPSSPSRTAGPRALKPKKLCPFQSLTCHKYKCMEHPSTGDLQITNEGPCRDGPSCARSDCFYSHDPTQKAECPLRADECLKFRCPDHPHDFLPATNKKPCRNGITCSQAHCRYNHEPTQASKSTKNQKKSINTAEEENKITVPSAVWLAFEKFYPNVQDAYSSQSIPGGNTVVTPKSPKAQKRWEEFIDKEEHETIPRNKDNKQLQSCQKLYFPVKGFYITEHERKIWIVHRTDLGPSLAEVVEDLKGRENRRATIPCTQWDIKEIKRLTNSQNLGKLIDCDPSIQARWTSSPSQVHLNGFVKARVMKAETLKLKKWMKNNCPTQEQLPFPRIYNEYWYQKCGTKLSTQLEAQKDVRIHCNKKKLTIRGVRARVEEAKNALEQILNNVQFRNCGACDTPGLNQEHYLQAFEAVLEEDPHFCIFMDKSNALLLGNDTDSRFQELLLKLRAIQFGTETITVSETLCGELAYARQEIEQLEDEYHIRIHVNRSTLDIAGSDENREAFKRYLDSDRKMEKRRVPIPPLVFQCLHSGKYGFLESWLNDHASGVRWNRKIDNRALVLEGTVASVTEASRQLEALFQGLEDRKKERLIPLLPYHEHLLECNEAELRRRADADGVKYDVVETEARALSDIGLQYRQDTPGGPTVEVYNGNIVEQSVDILVNAANSQLRHGGGVSGAINRQANIQEECEQRVQKEGEVLPGTYWLGSAGDLNTVQNIIHAVGPCWTVGCNIAKTSNLLEGLMDSLFQEANRQAAYSMAIPLISCNNFNKLGSENEKHIMSIIIKSVKKLKSRSGSTLKMIRFVEMDKQRLGQLVKLMKEELGCSGTIPLGPSTRARAGLGDMAASLRISCIPQVDLEQPCQNIVSMIREKTMQQALTHDKLPHKDLVEAIALKRFVKVDWSLDGMDCVLKGDKDAVQQMHVELLNAKTETIISRPPEWEGDDIRVDMDSHSQEYIKVVHLVRETMPLATIHRIERIQCFSLYKQFRTQLEVHTKNEVQPKCMLLFHGSRSTSPDTILQSGFNRSYAGSHCFWGRGAYFAAKALYSHPYCYKQDTTRQLFLVDVMVGDCITLPKDNTLIDAPPKEDGTRYHSVHGVTQGTDVYITYQDHRQYPKYLVHYSYHP